MDLGMLWRDDDRKRSLDAKIARAAAYYRKKYGQQPTTCWLHPSMLSEGVTTAAGLLLVPASTVQVNHFRIGTETTDLTMRPRVPESHA